MVYICAQPATFYYAWQIDAMLLSFFKCGINLSSVQIISSTFGNPIDPYFKKVEDKWSKLGVLFYYYKGRRPTSDYISSIRPYILKEHWNQFPNLENEVIFYHDCDIAFSKQIPNIFNMINDNIVYLSDTVSYIGADYIEGKGYGIFEKMCDIVEIDKELVRSNQANSGGAQYILKPGITSEFWDSIYKDSERLFKEINLENSKIKVKNPEYHELQIWCADMWALLWNLWKQGFTTKVVPELNFTWATTKMDRWEKNAIYHNAGATKEKAGEPFYKGKYMKTSPIEAPRPNDMWASQKYYDLIVEAWNATAHGEKKQIIRKRV
jgi:hypothetical protein